MSTAFSPARAAFEGFRVLGRNPLAFLAWTAFVLAVWVVLGAIFWLVAGADVVAAFSAMASSKTPDWNVLSAFMPKIFAAELVLMLIGAFSSGVLYNAIGRAVLRPEHSEHFYLRLGPAELRAGALYLLLAAATFALMGLGLAATFGVWASGRDWGPTVLTGFLAFVLGLAVWIFFAIRLCLAMPQVADTGRIDLRRAWRLSQGQFGPLIGMSLLIILITYAMQVVVQILIGPLMQGLILGAPKSGGVRHVFALMAANWPVVAGVALLMLVFGMVEVVVRYAPYAAAYRDLAVTNGDPDAFPASEF